LVTNEETVLNETSQVPEWKPCGIPRVDRLRAQDEIERQPAHEREQERERA
jgi:hypothetical protein